MTAPAGVPRFAVACGDYTGRGHRTREGAERELAGIVEAGHCRLAHEVVEVPR